jgi:hypothetical protein
MKTKAIAVLGFVLAFVCGGLAAKSHEGEFTWYKVTGPGRYHVDVVSGHGKTCYVFSEEAGTPEIPVLLWCENGESQP